ncbi:hypothetical protein OESDEN_10126 [Oesophagostomum dentatum]|uniref:Abnormal cell migration protein 18-like fibronectin type I domain-containing protein n=1 Tax=Oesophagostomum dentatum TaxID=61180 RepID=A0A0B1T3R6_OESDE|nr:hypothetical protein OESDEN_10126 [Oesophagostomum dentatum]
MRVLYVFVTVIAVASSCVENGKVFRDGDVWSTGQFLKKCIERTSNMHMYTEVKIIACLTPSNEVIKVGEEQRFGNTNYRCIGNSDGSVKLHSRTITVSPYRY